MNFNERMLVGMMMLDQVAAWLNKYRVLLPVAVAFDLLFTGRRQLALGVKLHSGCYLVPRGTWSRFGGQQLGPPGYRSFRCGFVWLCLTIELEYFDWLGMPRYSSMQATVVPAAAPAFEIEEVPSTAGAENLQRQIQLDTAPADQPRDGRGQ